MEMIEINCARCGKPEMVSTEQAVGSLPYEQAEKKLLKGENAPVQLCNECMEALLAFRKTLEN